MLRQRRSVPRKTFDTGGRVERTGDKRDIPMAHFNQLRDRILTGGFMIRPDALAAVFTQTTVKHHDRLLLFFDDLIHLIDA
ncbi:hypothetical protein D3C81_1745090 [compost metagenome]